MRNGFLAGFAVFLGLALIVGLVVGVWVLRYYTAKPKGIVIAQEQIQSAPSRIANYNHFFDLCASIQTNEAQLDALTDERAALGDTAPKDSARIGANIAGVQAARLGAISQYNVDARKDYTSGQFRDSNLPYQLPVTSYVKGGRTSCGSG